MTIQMDKQGRIVIPKIGLLEGGRLELRIHKHTIELLPLHEKDEPAILILREPCKTGDASRHEKAFSRERVWQ